MEVTIGSFNQYLVQLIPSVFIRGVVYPDLGKLLATGKGNKGEQRKAGNITRGKRVSNKRNSSGADEVVKTSGQVKSELTECSVRPVFS